jgi:hypothetical protein
VGWHRFLVVLPTKVSILSSLSLFSLTSLEPAPRYLSNLLPVILVAISAVALVFILLQRLWRPAAPTINLNERDDHTLNNDANAKVSLSAIEDRIIFSSVQDAVETSLRNGSRLTTPKTAMEKAGDWIGAVGALGLMGIALAQAGQLQLHSWGKPVFYVGLRMMICESGN